MNADQSINNPKKKETKNGTTQEGTDAAAITGSLN
jgi:hypothetical protein